MLTLIRPAQRSSFNLSSNYDVELQILTFQDLVEVVLVDVSQGAASTDGRPGGREITEHHQLQRKLYILSRVAGARLNLMFTRSFGATDTSLDIAVPFVGARALCLVSEPPSLIRHCFAALAMTPKRCLPGSGGAARPIGAPARRQRDRAGKRRRAASRQVRRRSSAMSRGARNG